MSSTPESALLRSLQAVRTHLGMEVAFLSEFIDGRRYFRAIDADRSEPGIQVGQSDNLAQSYCQRVVDGRLPELIADAQQNPEALTLEATHQFPIGAHMSVPVRLASGRVFGTLCCFSSQAKPDLAERDLALLRVLSDMLAFQIESDLQGQRTQGDIQARVSAAMASPPMRSVFQPIWNLSDGRRVGFEALTRFDCEPQRAPDVWFREAAAMGQGTALEIRAIACALEAFERLPQDQYLAVNASPQTVISAELFALLSDYPLQRIVLEITEHEEVDGDLYGAIAQALKPLRAAGLRLAVDDAGAGYACFKHILHLSPDIIKIDISITRAIDNDNCRQALAAALVRFAESIHCVLVAEGVETATELNTLRALGVTLVQGYFLAKPMALENALALPALTVLRTPSAI